jgi:hypothetical protein
MSAFEIHPRTFTNRLGEPPTGTRKFVATSYKSGPDVVPSIGSPHPDFANLQCTELASETGYEGDSGAIVYTATYTLPQTEEDPNPLNRPDIWSFSSSGVSVPAAWHIVAGQYSPIVNTAGDAIGGLSRQQLECRISVTGNRASFPMSTAAAVTNATNASGWGGANPRAWLCNGITGSQKRAFVSSVAVDYWEVTAELVYNEALWVLRAPNVGLNYISGGQKRRCYVLDEDGNYVPAPNPVALNADGSMSSGEPQLLEFYVYREVDFSTFFGSPPTS